MYLRTMFGGVAGANHNDVACDWTGVATCHIPHLAEYQPASQNGQGRGFTTQNHMGLLPASLPLVSISENLDVLKMTTPMQRPQFFFSVANYPQKKPHPQRLQIFRPYCAKISQNGPTEQSPSTSRKTQYPALRPHFHVPPNGNFVESSESDSVAVAGNPRGDWRVAFRLWLLGGLCSEGRHWNAPPMTKSSRKVPCPFLLLPFSSAAGTCSDQSSQRARKQYRGTKDLPLRSATAPPFLEKIL